MAGKSRAPRSASASLARRVETYAGRRLRQMQKWADGAAVRSGRPQFQIMSPGAGDSG